MYDVNNEHMFWELLETCYYDLFSSFIKFWCSERNTENTMPDLYFNEESDYSEQNASEMNIFALPLFNHCSLSLNRKKKVW